jgi:hypothetical protein
MPVDAAELLRRITRSAGIDAIYGKRCAPLSVTAVPDALASTFAQAHERVHGARAAVHRGNGIFEFPGAATQGPRVMQVGRADDLMGVLPDLASGRAVELHLLFDLSEPVDDVVPVPVPGLDPWVEPDDDVVQALRGADSVSVLVGPDVVRAGAVPGLAALAARANLGVLNTWGAKGVFHWRSRHHLATVGLQEEDFALSGLGQADLIIASGLDPLESPEVRWRLAPAFVVPPAVLAALAEQGPVTVGDIAIPPLRMRLAAVTQRGWLVEQAPLPPTRVTMHYGECVAAGALVAADAGRAGFWVARTLGTTRLGGAIVPSAPIPGFAAACVAVSQLRRPDRPALAVVDATETEATAAVVDAARSLGLHIPVESWDPQGERLNAGAHRTRLWRMLGGRSTAPPGVQSVATDDGQWAEMTEAAGPIVAWT